VKAKVIATLIAAQFLGGCVAIETYRAADHQSVAYHQGVSSVRADIHDVSLTMYPTFRYQEPTDVLAFTLIVQNSGNADLDFDPTRISVRGDGLACCALYTLEERVRDIRVGRTTQAILLAVAGGAATAAAANSVSHSTATYNSYGRVGNIPIHSVTQVRIYDPAAGIFAGSVVAGATGVGISQVMNSAENEEAAAQAILQRNTIAPGTSVAGQLFLRLRRQIPSHPSHIALDIPIGDDHAIIRFDKQISTSH